MRIKSELDAVSDQGQILIKRYGSLRDFLIQDENIAIIDDYICLHGDVETARKLALTQMMEKASMSNHAINGAPDDAINIMNQGKVWVKKKGPHQKLAIIKKSTFFVQSL